MVTGRITQRVLWGETDTAGIIYYPNYYRWFDTATHELFRLLGSPIATLVAGGHAPVLIEAQARFKAALRYDDVVEIESCVVEVRAGTFRIRHTVRRSDEIACEGYELRAWVGIEPGGRLVPERIPDQLRGALQGDNAEG